jgi:cold shock CspA family protein
VKGVVQRKIADRGFGFIKDGVKEYFFHATKCRTRFDDLLEGDEVKFEVEDSPQGKRAIQVERL